jgi:hypothetical protein
VIVEEQGGRAVHTEILALLEVGLDVRERRGVVRLELRHVEAEPLADPRSLRDQIVDLGEALHALGRERLHLRAGDVGPSHLRAAGSRRSGSSAPVALDTYEQAFDFSIVVPLDAVPATGLALQVFDEDQDVQAGGLIGLVRLTKQQLLDASRASNRVA